MRVVYRNLAFVTSLRFVITIYVLLQNKHTTLAENNEILIALNKCPPSRSEI